MLASVKAPRCARSLRASALTLACAPGRLRLSSQGFQRSVFGGLSSEIEASQF